jgi:hypothetical protein
VAEPEQAPPFSRFQNINCPGVGALDVATLANLSLTRRICNNELKFRVSICRPFGPMRIDGFAARV